jgi:putative ABC transport system substrate-binding protein
MRRREFMMLMGGAAAWPLAVRAQQPTKVPRIGVLLISGPEPMGPFREALRDLGYAEGKNIQIEVRSAQSQVARLPELAAELVRSQVDVIVAIQTPAVYAAKNATRDIPIVMMAGDPIATGLISNLARPDGNLTGLSGAAAELAAKSLELIPEMVPGARRVGVLGNANDPFMKPFLDDIQQRVGWRLRGNRPRASGRRHHPGQPLGPADGRSGAKIPAAISLHPKIRSTGGNPDVI